MGEEILQLLSAGHSYSEIVARLGCSKSTVHHHARKLGRTRTIRRYDWAAVQAYHDAGHSRAECTRHFGFSTDAWDKAVERAELAPRDYRIPIEELTAPERGTSRGHLKRRLLRDGLLVAKCYECGITEWRGQPISFDLHHINGDSADNHLENLALLCPNCHSQTPNYCGRNTGRARNRPPES